MKITTASLAFIGMISLGACESQLLKTAPPISNATTVRVSPVPRFNWQLPSRLPVIRSSLILVPIMKPLYSKRAFASLALAMRQRSSMVVAFGTLMTRKHGLQQPSRFPPAAREQPSSKDLRSPIGLTASSQRTLRRLFASATSQITRATTYPSSEAHLCWKISSLQVRRRRESRLGHPTRYRKSSTRRS